MKIRLLSTVICAAMVSTMVMGCLSGASAPANHSRSSGRFPETEVKTQQQGIRRQQADAAVDYSDVTVGDCGKFQHDFGKR